MVTFQTTRGGGTVELTSAQTKLMYELLSSDKGRRGDAGTFVGRDKAIFKAGGFLMAEAGRRGYVSAQSAILGRETQIARQLEAQGIKPVYAHGKVSGGEVGGMSYGIQELKKGVSYTPFHTKISPPSFLQQPQQFDISKVEPRVRATDTFISKSKDVLSSVVKTSPAYLVYDVLPEKQKVLAQQTKEFLFSEPDISQVHKQGVVRGGVEMAKWVAFKPFSIIGEGMQKFEIPEKEKVAKTISFVTKPTSLFDISLFKSDQKIREKVVGGVLFGTEIGVRTAGGFIPTTPAEAGFMYSGYKLFQVVPKVAEVGMAGLGAYSFSEAETPEEYVGSAAMIGGGGFMLGKRTKSVASFFSETRAKKTPYIQTFSDPLREKAVVRFKDIKTDKILYLVDKPSGAYTLPGGKIDKFETPKMAGVREAFEETGLKGFDLKFAEIIKTREHKLHIFDVAVDMQKLPPIKIQKKEVLGYDWFKPPKYEGAKMFEPYGRKPSRLDIFEKRIVKAEDLFVGSKAVYPELMQKELSVFKPQEVFMRKGDPAYLKQRVPKFEWKHPSTYSTKLFGRTPGAFKEWQSHPEMVFGFGSRYDIPFSKLKQYGKEKLWYAHGTGADIKTGLGKEFEVMESYMKRGAKVHHFQPPTGADSLGSKIYVGLSYLGLYKKPKAAYGYGISLFEKGKPTIQLYKGEAGKDLVYTKKARKGKEFEVGALPGTVFKVKDISKTYLAGRKVRVEKLGLVKTKGLSETDIEIGLKNIGKLSESEQKQFLTKIHKQTGAEYYSLTGKRPVSISEMVGHISSSKLGGLKYKTKYKPTKYKEKYKPIPYKEKYKTGYVPVETGYGYTPEKYSYLTPPTKEPAPFIPPTEKIELFEDPFKPPIKPPVRRTAKRKKKKKIKKVRKEITRRIAPSFTGIITGFKARPFISKKWGVSPATLRGTLTGK